MLENRKLDYFVFILSLTFLGMFCVYFAYLVKFLLSNSHEETWMLSHLKFCVTWLCKVHTF